MARRAAEILRPPSPACAENPLPERALNLDGLLCPLVGQKLYGAGLILEQFQEPDALFLPVLGEPVAVLAKLRAVGFEIGDAAVFFREQTLKSGELDLEFGRIGGRFQACLTELPIVQRGFVRIGFRGFRIDAEKFGREFFSR